MLGLIETVDVVMSHISSNLQASEPQVAIVGSSSVAGAWGRLWGRAVGAGGGCGMGERRCGRSDLRPRVPHAWRMDTGATWLWVLP